MSSSRLFLRLVLGAAIAGTLLVSLPSANAAVYSPAAIAPHPDDSTVPFQSELPVDAVSQWRAADDRNGPRSLGVRSGDAEGDHRIA